MAQPKNTLARVVVPLVAMLIGAGAVIAVVVNTKRQTPPTPVTIASAPTGPTSPATSPLPAAAQAPTSTSTPPGPSAPAPAEASATPPAMTTGGLSLDGLHAVPITGEPGSKDFAPLGSLDPANPLTAQITFSTLGAGVRSLSLARHFDTIQQKTHTLVQQERVFQPADGSAPTILTPLAAISVEIEGKSVPLLGAYESPTGALSGSPVWKQTAPGTFQAIIANDKNEPVVRLERRYDLAPNSYDVVLHQKADNLSGRPLKIRWTQFGPIDLPPDTAYGGDKRRIRFGYLLDPARQTATDPTVSSTDFVWPRANILGPATASGYETTRSVWPNDTSRTNGYRLVWEGFSNRYFGGALHPLLAPNVGPDQKVNPVLATVDRVAVTQFANPQKPAPDPVNSVAILHSASAEVVAPAGGSADFSQGFYAGPLMTDSLNADPSAAGSGLVGLIVYNIGGPCSFCTFTFLTSILLGVLQGLHYLVQDWGLSIILLVGCVRLLLHPVTRWSQIRMQRFGKQMQAMGPKQKKIQEKYANDPQKLREEMGRLWREEGMNPMGMLGCLPMFLQTPVWIALYATIFFFFPLRQAPAFYGVFQHIQPQNWPTWWFMGDLAEPDRLLYFGHTLFTVPFVGWEVQSLNILPVILAVVFFIQQKYLTPPPTPGSQTPEQEQQQKIMKWMMVFMFPLFMYKAPACLTLYFIVNSTLGIMESRYIRSHIDKYEKERAARGVTPGPKPGGFMARLQAMAQEKQKQMLKARGMQPPRKRV